MKTVELLHRGCSPWEDHKDPPPALTAPVNSNHLQIPKTGEPLPASMAVSTLSAPGFHNRHPLSHLPHRLLQIQ